MVRTYIKSELNVSDNYNDIAHAQNPF